MPVCSLLSQREYQLIVGAKREAQREAQLTSWHPGKFFDVVKRPGAGIVSAPNHESVGLRILEKVKLLFQLHDTTCIIDHFQFLQFFEQL